MAHLCMPTMTHGLRRVMHMGSQCALACSIKLEAIAICVQGKQTVTNCYECHDTEDSNSGHTWSSG